MSTEDFYELVRLAIVGLGFLTLVLIFLYIAYERGEQR